MIIKNIYHRHIPTNIRIQFKNFRENAIKQINELFIQTFDPSVRNMASRLSNFRGLYRGNRCFIMGNGPSLNLMNLDLFKNEYIWGSNRCYLLFDRIDWRPTFYVAVDKRVVPDNAKEINNLVVELPSTKFFIPYNFRYNKILKSRNNLFWFNETPYSENGKAFDNFSLEPSISMSGVRTVTLSSLQLAVYFGFNPIYLIGCDTSYSIPTNVHVENNNSEFLISIEDNDLNHFVPNYFGYGKKWHNPHVDRMIKHYEESYEVCNSINIEIFNATVGGNLKVFPRVNYLDLF